MIPIPACFRQISALLGCLLASTTLAQDAPIFTTDFPAEEFQERREAVLDAVGPGGAAVLQGAGSPLAYQRFRQTNSFYYLTGVETPHAYLLLDGASRRSVLYLPHRNARREASEGRLLTAEDADLARELTGVDDVFGDLEAERRPRPDGLEQSPADAPHPAQPRRTRRHEPRPRHPGQLGYRQ